MVHGVGTRRNALERVLLDVNAEPTDLPLSLLEDITNCFSDDQQIGSGGFAEVYKGTVGNEIVAVKRLSRTFDMHENKFHKEVECLMKAKHKNIVRFLGYCSDTQGKIVEHEGKLVMADIRNWLLCFEYASNGSLDKYITEASHGLDWRERYQIIKGICEGLCHLHEKRILHLDLKPTNILLDDHMIPKIADFGLARCLDKEQTRAFTSHLCGSMGYLAPEFFSGQISFASDIYSLGVIITEIVTGKKGYSEDENVTESWMILLETSDQADTLLEQVRVCTKIGVDCMNLDPKKRPIARTIVDMLEKTESDAVYSDESTSSIQGNGALELHGDCPEVESVYGQRPKKKIKGETAISSFSHNPPTSPAHGGGDAAPAGSGGGRSKEWWDHLSDPACPMEEFRLAFRMSRATFDALCDELSAAIANGAEDTTSCPAIPVHQRVAVCLWHFATGEPLDEVSRRFGLRISTCHDIVLKVCAALTTVLLPKAIRWPLDLPAVAASRFQALFGIPSVVGVVCTDHIPIRPPKDSAEVYYNRRLTKRNNKASYSVTAQAVVDADGTFMDVCIGLPGSLSDAAVLERSALHARCETGMLGHDQCWLVGGASYSLTDWMLVPYAYQNLTGTQHGFNERVAAARAAARGSFQRLKARWRCLQRLNEPKIWDLHNMIGACCVLHNFCERSGEELEADLQSELSQDEDDVVAAATPVLSAAAQRERDRIAHDLMNFGHSSVTLF